MMTYIHETIKSYRLQIGFTQEEAANRAGVVYQQWQRWENGTSIPTMDNFCKIIDALNIPWEGITSFFKTVY